MDTAPFTLEITQDAPAVFHAPSCSGSLDLRLGDCMDVMKTFADGHFDLAIVDPPYGIGMDGQSESKSAKGRQYRPAYEKKGWDKSPPPQEYFDELMRVSKDQIIWGGNYFPLPPKRGWVDGLTCRGVLRGWMGEGPYFRLHHHPRTNGT